MLRVFEIKQQRAKPGEVRARGKRRGDGCLPYPAFALEHGNDHGTVHGAGRYAASADRANFVAIGIIVAASNAVNFGTAAAIEGVAAGAERVATAAYAFPRTSASTAVFPAAAIGAAFS